MICPRCGSSYDAAGLRRALDFNEEESVDDLGETPLAIVESRLSELDGLMAEARAEIEALRSRELSAPLQLGCSFFGVFFAVTIVLAVFMLLGKSYFGSWLFYLCLALIVAAGALRLRRKLAGRAPREQLRLERLDLEEGLARLQSEHDRISQLRSQLSQDD